MKAWRMASAAAIAAALPGVVAQSAPAQYQEQYRPQYHFSPPEHWMNDPNGLVYFNGEYHLFYQYYPFGMQWGPMHWGHAVSVDLVHWKSLPIALYPDAHEMIFSGSAVVDARNSSGLGSSGSQPLIAIYTSHDDAAARAGRNDFQSQSIAYSLDAGHTWTKYAGNPVLRNPGQHAFRDPKVSWYEPGHKWIMTLAVGDHVSFYSSPDLKQWTHESDFGVGWGAHGGDWECPDLIEMKLPQESNSKQVLLVSVNAGGPNGGSATQYFVGGFDGHEFHLDAGFGQRLQKLAGSSPESRAVWVDYGPDDYAGVTWSGVPEQDGRRLFLGWMSNWQYAQKVPTTPWRSAMTLPRELSLVRSSRGYELHSKPVTELTALRIKTHHVGERAIGDSFELSRGVDLQRGLAEILLDLDLQNAGWVDLELANPRGQTLKFRINNRLQRYELDRTHSGEVTFAPEFGRTEMAPMFSAHRKLTLHAFVDRSSLELFLNDGETVMTSIEFPSVPYDTIRLRSDGPAQLKSATLYSLKSIWTSR